MEKVFWLVWEAGSGYTYYQHESEMNAIMEAKRLARKENGKRFYVLKAISHYQINNLQETILLEPSCDMPFEERQAMPAITMCHGEGCPQRDDCYRYIARSDSPGQSYFAGSSWDGMTCLHYWPKELKDE